MTEAERAEFAAMETYAALLDQARRELSDAMRAMRQRAGRRADYRITRPNLAQSNGGKARAAALSPERRREIASLAARARWGTADA